MASLSQVCWQTFSHTVASLLVHRSGLQAKKYIRAICYLHFLWRGNLAGNTPLLPGLKRERFHFIPKKSDSASGVPQRSKTIYMLAVEEFVEFFWKVAPGYHWQDSPRGRVLVPEPGNRRVYCPLSDDSCLFLTFARLSATEQAILAFARRYGLLTRGSIAVRPATVSRDPETPLRAREKKDADFLRGELIDAWRTHVEEMKFALSFWEALKANDEPTIRRYLAASSRTWDFRRANSITAVWFTVDGPDESYTMEAAWRVLSQLIQQQLSNGIHPMLSYQPARRRPHLTFEPRDLRSALWLQFSRAIEHDYSTPEIKA